MGWHETANALGGTAVLGDEVKSGSAFVHRVEEGLPGRALTELKRFSRLSDSDLTAVIPRRTLSTTRTASRLTPEQSDRVARTAGVVALAQRVFGSPDAAREWLLAPNPALAHEVPLRMLRTGSGGALVEDVLVRIDHGVYE